MAQASPSVAAILGEISSSKFKILRLLGSGGMGAVFEAEHVFTKRTGALKLLHGHFAEIPEVVERFTREASAAGRIQNPHIVETFDAGRLESGHPYMFMELLAGTPLDSLLTDRGALPFEEAIGICAQAAAGLAAAHKSGIIHRDIKPANLFLVEGKGTLVKILDFGISKFAVIDEVSQVTQEGAALGTPYYMPPEQVMGRKDIDEGVDIYALGVVLYECVTGNPPYVAETLPALSVRIYEGKYVRVSSLRADTPPGFDELLGRCLAVDRTQRFATVHDLLVALLALVGRHAESMAPTLMVGSPLPMLNSPLPYIPSQPPVWSSHGAHPSARPGPMSAEPHGSLPPPRVPSIPAGAISQTPPGASSAQHAVAPPVHSTPVPWVWVGLAAVAAVAVGGYLVLGGSEGPSAGVPAGATAQLASAGPTPDTLGAAGNGTVGSAKVDPVNGAGLGVDVKADPNAEAPGIAASIATAAASHASEPEQRNVGKNPTPSPTQSTPKTGASAGVRQPIPGDGLKRENPFD